MKIFLKALASFALLLCVYTCSYSQVVSSVRNGLWNDPDTWSSGTVPSNLNSTEILVSHNVSIPSSVEATPPAIRIDGNLDVGSGGKLILGNAVLTINGTWVVNGTFVFQNGGTINGASALNASFTNGSVFEFAKTTISELPLVNWFPTATLLINNLQGNNSVTHSSWIQNFGNVIYDCPGQGSFMDFNGRLRSVQGNLHIRNTNRNILRLARGHVLHLSVGGNLVVEGPSELWFGESGEGCTSNIGGSFEFRSTSTTSSYLTLSGSIVISIGENFVLDAVHKLKFTSTSGKTAVVRIGGDVSLEKGTIDALGTGRATIVFNGSFPQSYYRNTSALIDGHFNYIVEADADVSLGESLLSNTLSGSLAVSGKLRVGSTHSRGAIQDSIAGNIFVRDGINFASGSVLEYNGQSAQYMNRHPAGLGTTTIINNSAGVECMGPIQIGNLNLENGILKSQYPVSIANNFLATGSATPGVRKFIFNGISQIVDAGGSNLGDIDVTGDGPVTLVSGLTLSGRLTIYTLGARLYSNGYLTLESTSAESGENGSVGPLPSGAGIIGEVIVRRFMPAGRQYRYLSMPVKDVSVRQLQNSFPITGTFTDPSSGTGMISTSPSLFHYDESLGWAPFPVAGMASENFLIAGKGYTAFIRNAAAPVTWEVTGELLQGEVDLPVTWNNHEETAGWNLVGNPFASSVDWDAVEGWVKNNISESIAVRDNSEGRFRIWNGSVGDLEGGHIAPGQAFWVQATGSLPVIRANENAKIFSNEKFYRERTTPAYLQITLKTAAGYDHAYVQLSGKGRMGYDQYDMLKKPNDRVNISIPDSASGNLAILVTDRIPCAYQIPLLIEVPQGVTKAVISLSGYEEFTEASYTLYNRKTGVLSDPDDKQYNIELSAKITADYVLLVETNKPAVPVVDFKRWICPGQSATIAVGVITPGITYSLHAIDSAVEKYIRNGTSFLISYDSLQAENQFRLYATSVCGTESTTFTILKSEVKMPEIYPAMSCGSGSIKLKAEPKESRSTIHWYNNETDSLFIMTGNVFQTPVLERTKIFYASAYDSGKGCESYRARVEAAIIEIPSVDLILMGDTLVVLSGDSISWYYNNLIVDHDKNSYVPKKRGLYKVVAIRNGCSSSDSLYFHPAAGGKKRFSTFPNPATEIVSYPVLDEDHVILTDFIDSNGKSVFYLCTIECDNDYCHIKVGNLSRGVYFLIFRLNHDIEVSRIFLIK